MMGAHTKQRSHAGEQNAGVLEAADGCGSVGFEVAHPAVMAMAVNKMILIIGRVPFFPVLSYVITNETRATSQDGLSAKLTTTSA